MKMRLEKRVQRLLALANDGDKDARAKLDGLLRKYGLQEEQIPPMRGRGRPRKYPREGLAIIQRHFPSTTRERTLHNWVYRYDAVKVLIGDAGSRANNVKRWDWLLRDDYPRKTIVSQLGRVGNEQAIKIFADKLCELKPRAREAVKLLRLWEDDFGVFVGLAYLAQSPLETQEEIEAAARRVVADRPSL